MKDIFYIGPYRQNDSWGYTSKAFVNLLASLPIKLSVRPVWFTPAEEARDIENIIQYEYQSPTEKDIIIQHGLPYIFSYSSEFKRNIGTFRLDCEISNMGWVDYINLMDDIIVFSKFESELLYKSKIDSNINYLPYPPLYQNSREESLDLDIPEFKFFTIGSLSKLSGFYETCVAFLSTYTIWDNIILLVATENVKETSDFVSKIRSTLGIYSNEKYYPNIMIIEAKTDGITEFLHKKCDVFIDASYDAKPSKDTITSIRSEKLQIVPDTIGLFHGTYPLLIKTEKEIMINEKRPITGMYSSEFTFRKNLAYSIKKALEKTFSVHREGSAYKVIKKLKNSLVSSLNKKLEEILCL